MTIKSFDTYTWYARFLPALLVLLPASITTGLWLPQGFSIYERLGSTGLGSIAIAYLLAHLGRDLGYRKQVKLWERWGGAPTTQLLRHRTTTVNSVIRERYHRRLKVLMPDITLPTPEEEEKDSRKTDEIYGACTKFLITQTRDPKQFPLVDKGNKEYGFRRNLWGMKPVGIFLALLGIASALVRLWLDWRTDGRFTTWPCIIGVVNFAILIFWVIWVTRNWVRITADAYAERLLESCEQLKPPLEEKKVIWPPSTS
jgi:hypothetical protein